MPPCHVPTNRKKGKIRVWRQHSPPFPHMFLLPKEVASQNVGHGGHNQRRKSKSQTGHLPFSFSALSHFGDRQPVSFASSYIRLVVEKGSLVASKVAGAIQDSATLHAEIVEVEIEVVSPSIVPSGNFAELNRTVTCMVLKANDRRTSCPCHDEFRGPRSDYVRQVMNHGLLNTIPRPRGKVKVAHCKLSSTKGMSKSKIESVLIYLFDKRGIVHKEFAPPGQTINQVFLQRRP
ncbi:hypothetical protein TNCV_4745171 [Trichonephila clavipes]|nr:hypothetical protein TNCV_4745171 [Trichonephila clavipes]